MKRHPDTKAITEAMRFLKNESSVASAVQIMHLPSVRYPNYSQMYPQKVTGLHLAAYFGLENIALALLKEGADLEEDNAFYGRPLQAAALGGSLGLCRLLLEKRAFVNGSGGRYNTALQAAAFSGHDSVALLLLEN